MICVDVDPVELRMQRADPAGLWSRRGMVTYPRPNFQRSGFCFPARCDRGRRAAVDKLAGRLTGLNRRPCDRHRPLRQGCGAQPR